MWLDNISRLIQRMSKRVGVEVIAPFALDTVKFESGIRSLRHPDDLANFTLKIKQLVQLHFLPILDPQFVGVGVDAAERDMRVAHGLQQNTLNRFAVGME